MEIYGSRRTSLIRLFTLILGSFTTFALVISIEAPAAHSALFTSTISYAANGPSNLINPAGGGDAGWTDCGVDAVVVGFSWSGGTTTSSPYSIQCRTLNADGTIAGDQSTTANSTEKTVYVNNSAGNTEWCPAGKIAVGVRHRG